MNAKRKEFMQILHNSGYMTIRKTDRTGQWYGLQPPNKPKEAVTGLLPIDPDLWEEFARQLVRQADLVFSPLKGN